MKFTLKDGNSFFEKTIGDFVKNSFAQPLPIATSVDFEESKYDKVGKMASHYESYLFWRNAGSISQADQCSIVRWSTLAVEANRGYNVSHAQEDVSVLMNPGIAPYVGDSYGGCFIGGSPQTLDTWGGNSPLSMNVETSGLTLQDFQNLDPTDSKKLLELSSKTKSGMSLGKNRYRDYIVPTFDLAGSKELAPGSPLHINAPEDCFDINFIAHPDTLVGL